MLILGSLPTMIAMYIYSENVYVDTTKLHILFKTLRLQWP